MMQSFILGAVVGGLVVWRWHGQIQDYLVDATRGVRRTAADRLHSVQATAERVIDRTARPLRLAESALDQAKTQVRDTLRAGEEAIRPASEPHD